MEKKGYSSLNDFKGEMSFSADQNTEQYERIQFMKSFGSKE